MIGGTGTIEDSEMLAQLDIEMAQTAKRDAKVIPVEPAASCLNCAFPVPVLEDSETKSTVKILKPDIYAALIVIPAVHFGTHKFTNFAINVEAQRIS